LKPYYELEIVKVKGCPSAPWAMRMTRERESRYRLYHYKKEAIDGMYEWENLSIFSIEREFNHNFDSAETLGIESQ